MTRASPSHLIAHANSLAGLWFHNGAHDDLLLWEEVLDVVDAEFGAGRELLEHAERELERKRSSGEVVDAAEVIDAAGEHDAARVANTPDTCASTLKELYDLDVIQLRKVDDLALEATFSGASLSLLSLCRVLTLLDARADDEVAACKKNLLSLSLSLRAPWWSVE